MSRQKQLSIALQRRDSKKLRLWQLSADLSCSRMQRQGDSKMRRPREGEIV